MAHAAKFNPARPRARARQHGGWRPAFALGLLVALAIAVFALGDWSAVRMRIKGSVATVTAKLKQVGAAPGVAAPAAKVRFYECEHDGTRVLSSTPCGPGAKLREVDLSQVNSYSAPPLPPPPEAKDDPKGRHPGLLGPVRDNAQRFEEAAQIHPVAPDRD